MDINIKEAELRVREAEMRLKAAEADYQTSLNFKLPAALLEYEMRKVEAYNYNIEITKVLKNAAAKLDLDITGLCD